MRVVRVFYYKSCPPPPSPSPPRRPPLCRHLCHHLRHHLRQLYVASSRLRRAAPDLNCKLQIAACSAGPRPGSSRAECAAPDLARGAPVRSVQRRTSRGELPSRLCSARPQLPGKNQKICQTRISEDMPKRMSIEMPENI